MPKDTNIQKVLVIGSGAIVIGQAAEFDYAGTQACLALKEEGCEVILVNNNPATIMTDDRVSDKVYFEPLTPESITRIIEKERPEGLLAAVGGQTGLTIAMELSDSGVLAKYGVSLLGTPMTGIKQAEDRQKFRTLMHALDQPVPASDIIYSTEQALQFAATAGYPLIVRPAYTLGGFGGGIAADESSFLELVRQGLSASPIRQCLVEVSIAGYKEIEYEVMRDASGTCITICNMENLDPVGVHTGDSIVAAPSQTLNDPEYQMLRGASINIIEALGIVGACNVQFALHPENSTYYLIEVNPRVSRSSALASKATGYPIAKIAAKLALGYKLEELTNPVTGTTFASFEPALDYVAVKIPRWPFDQFPAANRTLGTQMKATGEVMAIERSVEAALQKAIRSLELPLDGFRLPALQTLTKGELYHLVKHVDDRRLFVLFELLILGESREALHEATGIAPFFLYTLERIVKAWSKLQTIDWNAVDATQLQAAKELGFSDQQLADIWTVSPQQVTQLRKDLGITPAYRMIDTCAAEFKSETNYFYSTWNGTSDKRQGGKKKVAVIGSGPIRIGQGIEFDYCCVHSVLAAQKLGYEAIMINNNPETVSTDFEIADALYFEPITAEDILNVLEFEGIDQVILQFGGQTSLNLAEEMEQAGITVLGSSAQLIDQMEDRDRFYQFLNSIGLESIPSFTAQTAEQVPAFAAKLGYPVLLRPSYVIGGSGMAVFHNEAELIDWLERTTMTFPLLVDHFIIGKEAEIDVLSDRKQVWISSVFEHLEGTGVHSGDSLSVTPPVTLSTEDIGKMTDMATKIAQQIDYVGLFNIQFVFENGELYVMEINPRASRTVPISSKVTGVPLVQHATSLMLGVPFNDLPIESTYNGQPEYTVKAPVFSHIKLPGLSPVLSPKMMSTGEVIGSAASSAEALQKALIGSTAGLADLLKVGTVFIADSSVETADTAFWKEHGFTVVTAADQPFDQWIQSDNKKAYIDFHAQQADQHPQTAAVHRVHVWTRTETAAAFKRFIQSNVPTKKGVYV